MPPPFQPRPGGDVLVELRVRNGTDRLNATGAEHVAVVHAGRQRKSDDRGRAAGPAGARHGGVRVTGLEAAS